MTQKAEPVTSSFNSANHTKAVIKHLLPKIIIVAVLIIMVIAAVVAINMHRKNEPISGLCTESLIKESYINFIPSRLGYLAANVQTIENINKYQHDPNCMYIVTVYDVNSFNVKQAQSSLALFNKAYNGKNLSPVLQQYRSVATLNLLVGSTNSTAQQDLSNVEKLSPPAKTKEAKK